MNSNDLLERIFEELAALRAKVDNLQTQLESHFGLEKAAQDADIDFVEFLTENSTIKAQFVSNPNRRGPRDIKQNPGSIKKPSIVQRYNMLLQLLHKSKYENSATVVPLDTYQLNLKRRRLHECALDLVRSHILSLNPKVRTWGEIEGSSQIYYSLVLEEKILRECDVAIYRCKKQWAARNLLIAAFKAQAKRRGRHKVDIDEHYSSEEDETVFTIVPETINKN